MIRPAILGRAVVLATALAVSTGGGAQVLAPKNNFDASVNGIFSLCGTLVEGGSVPDAEASKPFGFKPISAPAGQSRFKSLYDDGSAQLWFEPGKRMCTVHYSGAGFRAISGVARELAIENGFKTLKVDDPGAPEGLVLIRPLVGKPGREQFIIVEDKTSQGVSVAYFLKDGK